MTEVEVTSRTCRRCGALEDGFAVVLDWDWEEEEVGGSQGLTVFHFWEAGVDGDWVMLIVPNPFVEEVKGKGKGNVESRDGT